jgi:hypothetical protein
MKARIAALLVVAGALIAVGAVRQHTVQRPAPAPANVPTFNNQVVRIFQDHCQSCHHEGDIAPFSLMTYRTTLPQALNIKYMTGARLMPPWKPVTGCARFDGERELTADEIDTIAKWVGGGAPEGNPADLPTPLDFGSGWVLGQPDMVLSNTDAYTPPLTGDMYRCFTLPTNLPADQYVSAIDIHPGDRGTVHHVIAYVDTNGGSVALDTKDPGPGYTSFGGPGFDNPGTLGGWAPGARPIMLPDGIAYELAANSRVVLQVHYHPHGPVQPDKTEIGIYFAKKKPQKLMRILPLINTTFTIPPNDENYKVTASFPIATPVATHLWFIAPHMHLLGRKMRVEATLPGGTKQCLIGIDDWDFNWQGMYRYKDSVAFPAGTRLGLEAFYDNSSNNVRNPSDPPKPVSWGESTTDEMCIAFLGVTLDFENLSEGTRGDDSWIVKNSSTER